MTKLDDIQQAAEGAKVCPDCGRPYAASYPLWQCSDTTCGMSVEWNEAGENHEDCINECLYATKKHLREALAAQTEKAARAEQEVATACARMRAQKADLRSRIAELEAALRRAEMEHQDARAANMRIVANNSKLTDELRAELADVYYMDEIGCKFGTRYDRLELPAEIPGIDEDHMHFVLMPIGPVSRRAAAAWIQERLGLIPGGKTNG